LTEELDCWNCLTPSAVFLGYFKYAPPVVIGAFKCPGDIPEVSNVSKCHLSKYWTNNGNYNTIFKTLLPFIISNTDYLLSLLSVYGFRASLVSFWFVSNGNCISHSKETAYEIMVQVFNGALVLVFSCIPFFFENLLL
jgi:hypothetical protein